MRSYLTTYLLFVICLAAYPGILSAQSVMPAYLEGRVVDAETGEPLRGAHVFLSGTQIGTVTNPSGRFQLNRIPAGSHRLVISIIGYERDPVEMIFRAGDQKNIYKRLKPVVYELDEIYAGNLDNRWERHLDRFKRLFLGESTLADSTTIINPEVLRFESRWWGRFTAVALAPLQIENRALGYRITYYLDEFFHSGSRTRWTGDRHFVELPPADSTQAAYWKENRENAFEGSLRHFFLSLMDHRLSAEGFLLYSQRQSVHGDYRRNTFRTNPERIIQETGEERFFVLNFPGRLEIIYTEQGEDSRFPRWNQTVTRGPARVQTSYLQLNKRPITIDPNGEIVETYGATRFGYYSFQRVADKTPKDYLPEETSLIILTQINSDQIPDSN
jgi:hypothetical protein